MVQRSDFVNCSKCGKKIGYRVYPGDMCQGCYKYFLDGGTENPVPPPGKIEYDERGFVICHICGRAYIRLGSHLKETHNMTAAEYKEKFGICNNTKLTKKSYSEHMKKLAYENGMPERLLESGKETRFKKGDERIKTRNIRLQEKIRFAEHMKKLRKSKEVV